MERERPEYLPPIKPKRWSFPWMTVIGVTMLTLALFGVKQHLDTQAAWNERFTKRTRQATPSPKPTKAEIETLRAEEERAAKIAEIRLKRAAAEREALFKDRNNWRCINGTPFRKIPGGWENVPGERC